MKRALIVLGAAVILITAGISDAQVRDWLTGNVSKNSSTVTDFLVAVQSTDSAPAYRDELRRLKANVGMVFVPGILGSALKSGTGEEIWGYSLRMTDGLRLPPALVDPDAASDVRATIADGNGTLNLYGEAMAMIRASATRAGIAPNRIVACGYDWRRDIRAGARDLKRCIETSQELKGIEALIVIAHSMGGLVTFQWHRDNTRNGVLGDGTPVIAVAMLGSPLAGSCEIVRMISKGYVQPTANELFLRAKRGLAMAMQLNWVAAIGDLRFAVPKLEARYQRLGAKEKENERELRINATANLARALVMRGFCGEAKPYVKGIPSDNRWAVDLGKAQCFDRDTGKIVSLR